MVLLPLAPSDNVLTTSSHGLNLFSIRHRGMSLMEVCLPSGSLCTCFGAAEFEAMRLAKD